MKTINITKEEFLEACGIDKADLDPKWLESWKMPIVIGDYRDWDMKLEFGLITEDERQKMFEKAREHGMNGEIHPFAIGMSDAPTIIGVGFNTKMKLYHTKVGTPQGRAILDKQRADKGLQKLFKDGHKAEPITNSVLELATGLKVYTCPFQVMHPLYETRFPHITANIDGLTIIDGKLAIVEDKLTNFFTDVHCQMAGLKGEEVRCPDKYYPQVQGYMQVYGLDKAVMSVLVKKNNDDGSMTVKGHEYLFVEHDNAYSERLLDLCEEFVEECISGHVTIPADLPVSKVQKDLHEIYGAGDPSLPPVEFDDSFGPLFEAIDEANEAVENAGKELEPMETEIKAIKEKYKGETAKLKKAEKERDALYVTLAPELGAATAGVYQNDEHVWQVDYDVSKKPCFDKEVKDMFKEKYPTVFTEVMGYKPAARNIKISKTDR